MTIATTTNRVDAPGNGSATSFSFSPVVIFEASDIQVTIRDVNGNETPLVQGGGSANYSVSVTSFPDTGSITYPASGGSPLASGNTLVIKRIVPITQSVSLGNQGAYFPNIQEKEFDYLTAIDQQQQEQLNRTLQLADTDPAVPLFLPAAAARASKFFAFDALGQPITVSNMPGPAGADTGAITPQQFGAVGDGVHDDSSAIQSAGVLASTTGRALHLQAVSVGYLVKTPINWTNLNAFTVYGDGYYPCTARITPVGGSVIIGATGSGHCVIDAMGTSGLKMSNLTIASIGITNASTVGVIHGNTTTSVNGSSSCVYEDVSILLPQTGASVGIYGMSTNLMSGRGVRIMSDYCLYLTDVNTLSIAPPYGILGSNIQSDGCDFSGVNFFAYGGVAPFVLKNVTSHDYRQLYIVNINGGSGFTGQPHAMQLTDCWDVNIKVEIDYFPCAVLQLGQWHDVNLAGIIYQWTTPMLSGQPSIASLDGSAIFGGRFDIRGLAAMPSGTVAYGSSTSPPTLQAIVGTYFAFDTAINATTAFIDFTGVLNPILMFNVRMEGNTDGPPMTLQLSGVALTGSQYRIFVNGVRTGSA